MNNSGDQQPAPRTMEFCSPQQKPRRPIALSRSVVLTEEGNIPSLLLLGKLLSDGAPDMASLRAKLLQDWGPSGTVNFWRVTDSAFLVQFYKAEDLTRVLDGAPWSCDGDDLFLMQHVKPDINMLDQVGFTKAEIWVQFHGVPVDYFSAASVYALAARIGEPVAFPNLGASPVEFLRARIRVDITQPLVRSVDVALEDGKCASVSVVYELVRSLCGSCGILGHPADRCGRAKQPAAAATARREKPAGYSRSRLGPGLSTPRASSPLRDSGGSITSPLQSEEPSGAGRVEDPPMLESAPAPATLTSRQERPSLASRVCLINFIELIRHKKWKKVVRTNNPWSSEDNLDKIPSNLQKHQTLLTISAQENVQVQEPFAIEAQVNQAITSLAKRSHFQLGGGHINYYRYLGSRKNPRIEVTVETQCSPQLIIKAMKWLSENTGLRACASYDGKRGVISIVGLQIDQTMGPVDLIAYLYPMIGPQTGAETHEKPDSPARFEDIIIRLHDENCCKATRRK